MKRLFTTLGAVGLAIAQPPAPQAKGPQSLKPITDATGKCFDFPASGFSETNSIEKKMPHDPTVWMSRGEPATDFVLQDVDGERVVLSQLLSEGKPVVLLYGMYTCPAFQGLYVDSVPGSHFSKYDEWALVEQYKTKVTFVHLYSVEPHPRQPDANFDKGYNIEFPWSTVRQPKSYALRWKNAEMVRDDIHEDATLLLDDLGNGYSLGDASQPEFNPVWCTYGPGARLGFLIDTEGVVFNTQAWFHSVTMAVAIEELLLLSDKLAAPQELEIIRSQSGVTAEYGNETALSDAMGSGGGAAASAAPKLSEEEFAAITTGRDHEDERLKALTLIRYYTAKYAAFRESKLAERGIQAAALAAPRAAAAAMGLSPESMAAGEAPGSKAPPTALVTRSSEAAERPQATSTPWARVSGAEWQVMLGVGIAVGLVASVSRRQSRRSAKQGGYAPLA